MIHVRPRTARQITTTMFWLCRRRGRWLSWRRQQLARGLHATRDSAAREPRVIWLCANHGGGSRHRVIDRTRLHGPAAAPSRSKARGSENIQLGDMTQQVQVSHRCHAVEDRLLNPRLPAQHLLIPAGVASGAPLEIVHCWVVCWVAVLCDQRHGHTGRAECSGSTSVRTMA